MKKMLPFLIALLVFSCAKDDNIKEEQNIDQQPGEQTETYAITGRFLAPNSEDPIAKANARLYSNNEEIATTTTNEEGMFSFQQLYPGTYIIRLNKGYFSSESTVEINDNQDQSTLEIGDVVIEDFPKIGVVTGMYDNIESVLYDIGLVNPVTGEPLFDIINGYGNPRPSGDASPHGHQHSNASSRSETNQNLNPNVDFSFQELLANPTLLAQYDILFFNCGLDTTNAYASDNLYNYVANGGILYATDWAYPYLEYINELTNNTYLNFLNPYKSGISLTTDATILNDDLSNWLAVNFGISANGVITIDEFLPSWQVVDTYDEAMVTPWLNGSVDYEDETNTSVTNTKYLAFTYPVGDGGIFYSSFHTENEESGFSDVDRIMEYMVFELSTLGLTVED